MSSSDSPCYSALKYGATLAVLECGVGKDIASQFKFSPLQNMVLATLKYKRTFAVFK